MKSKSLVALLLCLSILFCLTLTSCSYGFRFSGSYESKTNLLITSATTKYTFNGNGTLVIKYFLGDTLWSTSEGTYYIDDDKSEISITITKQNSETDESGATQEPTSYGGTYKFEYGDTYVKIGSTTYTKVGK